MIRALEVRHFDVNHDRQENCNSIRLQRRRLRISYNSIQVYIRRLHPSRQSDHRMELKETNCRGVKYVRNNAQYYMSTRQREAEYWIYSARNGCLIEPSSITRSNKGHRMCLRHSIVIYDDSVEALTERAEQVLNKLNMVRFMINKRKWNFGAIKVTLLSYSTK